MHSISVWAATGWLALHVSAWIVAWGTRVAVGSQWEAASHIGFWLAMSGIGASALIGRQIEAGLWVPSSITLMAMVLIAVVDLRRPPEPPAMIWG